MEKEVLLGKTPEEIQEVVNELGLPKFTGKQLVDWIYNKRVDSFETMSNLSIPLVVLGFALSALLRVSQGSTTVALVTTSTTLGSAIASTGASPVLVGLAICAGGIGFSLPNDSGFWVLNRFSGISVSDTIKSWTFGGTIASFSAFAVILILDLINRAVGLPLLGAA